MRRSSSAELSSVPLSLPMMRQLGGDDNEEARGVRAAVLIIDDQVLRPQALRSSARPPPPARTPSLPQQASGCAHVTSLDSSEFRPVCLVCSVKFATLAASSVVMVLLILSTFFLNAALICCATYWLMQARVSGLSSSYFCAPRR
jgi:hypothetical protein